MISSERQNYFSSLSIQFKKNPKRFWSSFKLGSARRTLPNSVSMILADNSRTKSPAGDTKSKAEIFNKYFVSVFNTQTEHPSSDEKTSQVGTNSANSDDNCLSEIEFTEENVLHLLNQLDITKATGPDGISNRILRETSHQIAPSLCILFNMSIQKSCFPSDWKLANVVPVFKKGDTEHVGIIDLSPSFQTYQRYSNVETTCYITCNRTNMVFCRANPAPVNLFKSWT